MPELQQTEINSEEVYPEISIKECLLEGWDMFKKHWMVIIGGSFLLVLLYSLLDKIPYIGILISMFLISPLTAGYTLLELNAGKDSNPSMKNILEGFDRFGLSLAYFWTIGLVLVICMIPIGIFMDITTIQPIDPNHFSIISILSDKNNLIFIGGFLVIFFLFAKYYLSIYILIDEPKRKLGELFKESKFLSVGYTLTLIKLFSISFSVLVLKSLIFEIIPLNFVTIITGLPETFNSIPSMFLSIIYISTSYIFSGYISLVFVRFYLKLKDIKQKPPFTVTHDPI